MNMICVDCYTVGNPKKKFAGSWVVELALYIFTWWLLFIPALVYSHWRSKNAVSVCGICGGVMIPLDTPRGQHLAKKSKGGVSHGK